MSLEGRCDYDRMSTCAVSVLFVGGASDWRTYTYNQKTRTSRCDHIDGYPTVILGYNSKRLYVRHAYIYIYICIYIYGTGD